MQSAWCHFRATLTNFRSPDVKNVIFGKTAITLSFLAKDFKSKLELSRTSYRVIPILKSAHVSAQIGKKVFKCGYHVYKNIDMLYLSNGAR